MSIDADRVKELRDTAENAIAEPNEDWRECLDLHDLIAILDAHLALQAVVERLKKDYDWMMAQHDMWKACSFKEAELKDGFKVRAETAEAELDAARPLLDAVENCQYIDEIHDAALDYREKKGEPK